MAVININGIGLSSSTISSSIGIGSTYGTSCVTLSSNMRVGSSLGTNYHVLGEDIFVSGYQDQNLIIMISTLNILGKPFLDELHKNSAFFPTEIEKYLTEKFKWLERDKKIDDIIN
jgi:hypothetical protein